MSFPDEIYEVESVPTCRDVTFIDFHFPFDLTNSKFTKSLKKKETLHLVDIIGTLNIAVFFKKS